MLPVMILLAGCDSKINSLVQLVPLTLSPYFTRTPLIIPTLTQPATFTPVITTTPFIYKIARNDTLSSIARRFKVTIEALLAANPGVVPQALTVGQTLTIPPASQASAGPQSTPEPLDLGAGYCQPSGSGTNCLVPVHNPYPYALENVTLQVTLLDENGQSLASQEAALPLNILPPDQVLPASVFFSDQILQASVRAQVLTSTRLAKADARYLKTDLQNLLVSIAWDGLSARAQGRILLPETEKAAGSIWLAAVAYAADGQIVGLRRWEWSGSLQPAESQAFDQTVYSLGPPIQHVEILVEARP
jgi:LysM repeat protein